MKMTRRSKKLSDVHYNIKNNYGEWLNNTLVIICCVLVALCNYCHVAYMQENNTMFSHLSTMEREMSFRTEMGFYYSFYKQVIEAPSFLAGVHLLTNDNLTEHPYTINALQRFNLYPELTVAILYRGYMSVSRYYGVETRVCYSVNRHKLPSVQSCEGFGEPAIFYVHVVILLNAAMLMFVFLIGRHISGHSVLGGLVSTLFYFYNHRECTRVQWTPPLRESFSYPFLLMQQLFLLQIYTHHCQSKMYLASKYGYFLTTLFALLSWQFAQFSLLTQCIAVFVSYLVAGDCHTKKATQTILSMLLLADLVNVILQFGNTLLLVGPLRPCAIMALVIITMEPSSFRAYFHNSVVAPIRWTVLTVGLLVSAFLLKYAISVLLQIKSDDHMIDILRSKLSDFRSFDSLLYTCAPEFDVYDVSSLFELSYTGLVPISLFVIIILVSYTLYQWCRLCRSTATDLSSSDQTNFLIASGFCSIGTFYLLFQTIAYTFMAALIMRLKLFWTPHLCLLAAYICHHRWPLLSFSSYISFRGSNASSSSQSRTSSGYRRLLHLWPVILVVALCSVRGVSNLRAEWAIQGSYSNWEQEQLMLVISERTSPHHSFVGQMATMSTVRLVTGRHITMHPHYEDEHLRGRVHISYTVYSRKSIHEVWLLFRSTLHATHFVFEPSYCALRLNKPGCSYIEMWDLVDHENAQGRPLCQDIINHISQIRLGEISGGPGGIARYFKWIFTSDNGAYTLFEVLPVPVS